MDDILRDLNEQQRAAAAHGAGPLLIVAGAGTGKTMASLTASRISSPRAPGPAESCC